MNNSEPIVIKEILQYPINGYVLKSAGFDYLKNTLREIYLHGDHFIFSSIESIIGKKARMKIQLSEKEKEIIYLTRIQLSNYEIADKLGLSIKSVEKYKSNLISLTDSKKMTGVIEYLIRHQIIAREV